MARQMPIEGAWVQQGWQEQGVARILLARAQPNDDILFGEYIVDYFCVGVKDSSYASNLNGETFLNEALPRLYSGTPPLDISENLAHEIIWGAVEYAGELGFEPHRNFRESVRILEPADALPRSGAIEFGYQGRPFYMPGPSDNQVAVIRRLIEAVGLGNFYYLPRGEIPAGVAELLQVQQPDDAPDPEIWTPGQNRRESADSQSGLWVPGHGPESEPASEGTERPLIWTPGRS